MIRQTQQNNMKGKFVFTEDVALSASQFGSVIQRGAYTLGSNTAQITFPRVYLSSDNFNTNLSIQLTSQTTNPAFVASVAKVSALGQTNVSSVSGFTISGSGSDTGYWFAIGYK